MRVEQSWAICAGPAATRFVAVTRSVNAGWTSKAARLGGEPRHPGPLCRYVIPGRL
jgi:hypothetical protein